MSMLQGGQGPITEINVTPLVDVCLVLVIIFMVIAPFVMQAGIEIGSSGKSVKKGETSFKDNVNVVLSADGSIRINGQPATWQNLAQSLREALDRSRDRLVSLSASEEATVGQVVEILDTSKQNGAIRLAVLNP